MKISIINIVVSILVMAITAGLFYFNRRPSENIDNLILFTLLREPS